MPNNRVWEVKFQVNSKEGDMIIEAENEEKAANLVKQLITEEEEEYGKWGDHPLIEILSIEEIEQEGYK
jgi:hypothetical protein